MAFPFPASCSCVTTYTCACDARSMEPWNIGTSCVQLVPCPLRRARKGGRGGRRRREAGWRAAVERWRERITNGRRVWVSGSSRALPCLRDLGSWTAARC